MLLHIDASTQLQLAKTCFLVMMTSWIFRPKLT
jgi:hypothetical protein